MRDIRVDRENFALEFPICMVPWCCQPSVDTHEIARGGGRDDALKIRAAWLRLCRLHHNAMGDYSRWPLESQYAIKALADTEYYDRVAINSLRDRQPDAISELDVLRALGILLHRHGTEVLLQCPGFCLVG